MIKKVITIMITISLASNALAVFKNDGWQWYKDKPYIEYSDIKEHQEQKAKPESKLSPTEQMEQFHKEYNNVTNYAYLHPDDNKAVAAAMAYNKYVLQQSKRYAATFEENMVLYPHLSSRTNIHTSQVATQIMRAEQAKKEEYAIKKVVAKEYGLFWFYEGNDVYAQAQAASLQEFADKYDIALIGISMDGTAIKAIHKNKINQGQAEKYGVKDYPAIFLVNPRTKKVYPVIYGFTSMDELKRKIYKVVTRYGRDEIDV